MEFLKVCGTVTIYDHVKYWHLELLYLLTYVLLCDQQLGGVGHGDKFRDIPIRFIESYPFFPS
jgi:hypothetical protein